MKYFGSTASFIRDRNREIMKAFRSEIARASVIRMEKVCQAIAESPASRFWVSAERAAIVISAMESGRKLPVMTPMKREMFNEIFSRYRRLRDLNPTTPLIDLAAEIVTQPAPKFYYTPRTISEIIYRIRNGWYDRPR